MRWADERYVRLYAPRNDGDWDMWPWEARALFPLMLRKADRIGVIKCGKHGAKALAKAVDLPLEHVEVGLTALLEDGCVTEPKPGVLFIRNYLNAQDSPQTDRARKEAQRERDRDRMAAEAEGLIPVTNRDGESHIVTNAHESGQKVTSRHAASQVVTPGRAEPGRAEPMIAAPVGAATPIGMDNGDATVTPIGAARAAKIRKPRASKPLRPAATESQVSMDAALEKVPVRDILQSIATASGGRFTNPSELSAERNMSFAGYCKGKTLRQLRAMGEFLGAGGWAWKGQITIANIAKKDDFVELFDLARVWDESKRPDPQMMGRPAQSHRSNFNGPPEKAFTTPGAAETETMLRKRDEAAARALQEHNLLPKPRTLP